MTCIAIYLLYLPADKFCCLVIIPGDWEAISEAEIFFERAYSKIKVATSKISHENEKLESFLLAAASRIVHTERTRQKTAAFLAQSEEISRWWTTAFQHTAVKSYKNRSNTSHWVSNNNSAA